MNPNSELAARVGAVLKAKRLVLATAESCTGGGVAKAITEISGSSEWFDGGVVSYSNMCKMRWLNVAESDLAQYGAVSEAVAIGMAKGVLAASQADIAISTTGIAGPTGAVPGKPVGTVWMAWVSANQQITERIVFAGDRQAVSEQAIAHVLRTLLAFIEKEPAKSPVPSA